MPINIFANQSGHHSQGVHASSVQLLLIFFPCSTTSPFILPSLSQLGKHNVARTISLTQLHFTILFCLVNYACNPATNTNPALFPLFASNWPTISRRDFAWPHHSSPTQPSRTNCKLEANINHGHRIICVLPRSCSNRLLNNRWSPSNLPHLSIIGCATGRFPLTLGGIPEWIRPRAAKLSTLHKECARTDQGWGRIWPLIISLKKVRGRFSNSFITIPPPFPPIIINNVDETHAHTKALLTALSLQFSV